MTRDTRTADDVITAVTTAATDADAEQVMAGLSHGLLLAVADLLYIDNPEIHGPPWLRREIVAEARY